MAVNNHSNRELDLKLVDNEHGTRSMSAGKFKIPKVHNYYGDRTLKKRIPYILYIPYIPYKRIPYIYNSLPEDIRREPVLSRFKFKLKKYFLSTV